MAQGVLQARALAKRFGDVQAVDGVDLTVRAGERVGLLGPNGAGKTTTLLMLLGATLPDRGEITIAGHRLPRHRSKAMEHVGFAAGYLPLPDKQRVREALELFGNLYGIADPGPAITEALERFRIPHLADRMCMDLSSGQRTLVGICKAILHRPELLVLDEPTASLDPDVAMRVRNGLLQLNRDVGTAILVTSHDMVEVERLCERVVFIAGGRVVADGPPEQVASQFGHGSLEGVFLQLAGSVDDGSLDDELAAAVREQLTRTEDEGGLPTEAAAGIAPEHGGLS
jgi:ABC-2 type transport system ATP-binding protein